jgi:hypothetical protein
MSLHVGDVGALIVFETGNITLPGTDTLTILIKKGSGATIEWLLVPADGDALNTLSGDINYYTKSGNLDEDGQYEAEIKRVTAVGKTTKSDVGTFEVKAVLF